MCIRDRDIDEDESPLSMKADFLLSLCELVVGGKDGLQPIEKTVIDRCCLLYTSIALPCAEYIMAGIAEALR